jgi:DNA invertase Pin-like site-specific DNA recombinase
MTSAQFNSLVVGYCRKSTEEDERQVMPLDRQREAIHAEAVRRELTVSRWFLDAASGNDIRRDGYRSLAQFGSENKQTDVMPGTMLCYSYDPFSRSVDRHVMASMHDYSRAILRLHDYGWELDFAITPKSANGMIDAMLGTINPIMAADYISKLSASTREGKKRVGTAGFWVGGPDPWPSARFDTRLGVKLLPAQRSSNAACILVPLSHRDVGL